MLDVVPSFLFTPAGLPISWAEHKQPQFPEQKPQIAQIIGQSLRALLDALLKYISRLSCPNSVVVVVAISSVESTLIESGTFISSYLFFLQKSVFDLAFGGPGVSYSLYSHKQLMLVARAPQNHKLNFSAKRTKTIDGFFRNLFISPRSLFCNNQAAWRSGQAGTSADHSLPGELMARFLAGGGSRDW